MPRSITVAIMSFALLALAAAPALAQYPPAAPTVAVGDTTVVPGQTTTVVGDGWQPGSTVRISLGGSPLGDATVGDDGRFRRDVTVPRGTAPGTYNLTVAGTGQDGQPRTVTVQLRVVAPGVTPARPGAPALPTTGSGALAGMLAAGGLIVVGAGAVFAARQRSRSGNAA